MRIKKYKAANMKEGKALVVQELGEKAVILSTRTIEKPGKAPEVEIVAAIDESPLPPSFKRNKTAPEDDALQKFLQKRHAEGKDSEDYKKFVEIAGLIFDRIGSLTDSMQDLSENVRYKNIDTLSKSYSSVYKLLYDSGFSNEYALRLTGVLSADNPEDNIAAALKKVRKRLISTIRTADPIKKRKEPVITAFLGPTGSGKTTTVAKLGIVNKMLFDSSVLFISTDTKKIGGAEQLETYGAVAGIPFIPAYSAKELKETVLKNYETDFIFIDTPGISQFDEARMKELKNYLMQVSLDHIYLVQSVNSSRANFQSVLHEFKKVKANALILTKFDEAASIGEIIEAMQAENLPLAYFTNGQKVPDDIEPAEPEKLEEIIFPDEILAELK